MEKKVEQRIRKPLYQVHEHMKICIRCKVEKPETDFYSYHAPRKGLWAKCKSCLSETSKKYRGYKSRKKHYYIAKENPEKMAQLKARGAVRRALKNGVLIKEKCVAKSCKSIEDVQAHHHLGYSKENWLVVMWLCPQHHADIHNNRL